MFVLPMFHLFLANIAAHWEGMDCPSTTDEGEGRDEGRGSLAAP